MHLHVCSCVQSFLNVCMCSHVSLCVHLPAPLPPVLSQLWRLPAPCAPCMAQASLCREWYCQGELTPQVAAGKCLRAHCPVSSGASPRSPGRVDPLTLRGSLPETGPSWRPSFLLLAIQEPECQLPRSWQGILPIHPVANSALTQGWSPAGRWQDTACSHTGSCRGC